MQKAYQRFLELLEMWTRDARVLAVLGLGSLARLERMDAWSDLDFFLVVEEGTKEAFLQDPSWLDVPPHGFIFKNSKDGFKAMTRGDVFLECAVFSLKELHEIPYDRPKLYYVKEGIDPASIPMKVHPVDVVDKTYAIHEAITNLYIGLLRLHRGERYAARMMIQEVAFQNYLRASLPNFPLTLDQDPYRMERRFERAFPDKTKTLHDVLKGYDELETAAKHLFILLQDVLPEHPLYASIDALLDERLGSR